MKKFLIAIAAALVLCVPAFADNEVYFAPSPFTFSNPSGYLNITATSADPSVPCYYFLRYSNSGNTELRVFAITATQGAAVNYSGVTSDGTSNTSNNNKCNLAAGDYFVGALYFVGGTDLQNLVTTDNLSIFPYNTDMSVIGSAFADYLLNPPAPSPSLPTSFTVPRGNVLYFQVASNSDVNFASEFSENSGLFSSGNVYGPWGDTYQRISIESSLPAAGIEFPRSGSDAIVWGKGEPLNVLGQTKVGVFTKSCSSGTYYAFYNPAYQSITSSDGFGSASVGSNVTVSGNFSFIRIYSLQQIYDISTSTNDYDDYYVGTPDGDGGVTWVDQDDQVSYPSSGGENQEDEPISSVSLIESIKRILRNILSEIESIFTFGFSAIRDLVDLMDEFVATFDDLYEWLPEECYTLLIACVSVAIAIGVFKVFL